MAAIEESTLFEAHEFAAIRSRPSGQLLKWVGNKQRYAEAIAQHLPADLGTYFEPFVGTGAVLATMRPERAIAGDTLSVLIDLLKLVQVDPDRLVTHYEAERDKIVAEGKSAYQLVRARFNADPNPDDLLVLNRTGDLEGGSASPAQGLKSAATSASTSSTGTWSSKWPGATPTQPSPVCGRTWKGAPPAARSTRACTRSSAASRLSNPLKHRRRSPGAVCPCVSGAIGSATPLQSVRGMERATMTGRSCGAYHACRHALPQLPRAGADDDEPRAPIARELGDPPPRRALENLTLGRDSCAVGDGERPIEHAPGAGHLLRQPPLVDGRAEEHRQVRGGRRRTRSARRARRRGEQPRRSQRGWLPSHRRRPRSARRSAPTAGGIRSLPTLGEGGLQVHSSETSLVFSRV